jgi:hypothetical protein
VRRLLSYVMTAALVSQAVFLSAPLAHAAATDEPSKKEKQNPLEREAHSTKLLRIAVGAVNQYPTAADLVSVIKRKSDRDLLLARLGTNAGQPVKVQFVEPHSYQVRFGGEQVNVDVKDVRALRFSILKKEFTYDPNEPAEEALQLLQKMLAQNDKVALLIPEAHAIGPLILLGIYLSVAGTAAVTCAEANVNSVGVCAGLGLGWLPIGGYLGYKLTELAIEKTKLYYGSTTYDLLELTCPQGNEPLKATVLDADKKPMQLEISFNASGEPEKIDYKFAGGTAPPIYVKAGWEADKAKMPNYSKLDFWEYEMAIRGAHQIRQACLGGDSQAAMMRFMRQRGDATSLAPQYDPFGVKTKKVE